MAEMNIIDPYDSYEMLPLEGTPENYGSSLLNTVSSLQVGFGSKVLRIDRDGLWMGAEDFSSAPFSVDMDGNMTATSLDLSNYLQVGQSLADIQALIGDLSGINDDLGTITAGNIVGITITGGTIQTSTSGARVVISGASDNIIIYDASAKRMELDKDSLTFYDSSGSLTSTLHSDGEALDVDVGEDGFLNVNFNNNTTISGIACTETGGNDVVFYAGGLSNVNAMFLGANIALEGNITPSSDLVYDIGTSSYYMDNVYVDDLYVDDDIIMGGGTSGNINGIGDLFLLGQTSSPTATGQLRYYSSGGIYGLRMKIPGFTLQFQADLV